MTGQESRRNPLFSAAEQRSMGQTKIRPIDAIAARALKGSGKPGNGSHCSRMSRRRRMKRSGRLSGFEVYRGKGRRARRIGVPKGGILFNLYMTWLRRGDGPRVKSSGMAKRRAARPQGL